MSTLSSKFWILSLGLFGFYGTWYTGYQSGYQDGHQDCHTVAMTQINDISEYVAQSRVASEVVDSVHVSSADSDGIAR